MQSTKLSKEIIEGGSYRTIPGYPMYEIDQTGSINRVYKTKRTAMVPMLKNGIFTIKLTGPNSKRKEERIHKLMQLAYLPPAPPGFVVYHKNGNKQDNYVNNLGYISRIELGKATGAKSRRKAVAKISQSGEVVEIFTSSRAAGRANFMSYQTVIDRCNGKVKSEYAPDGNKYVWDKDLDYG